MRVVYPFHKRENKGLERSRNPAPRPLVRDAPWGQDVHPELSRNNREFEPSPWPQWLLQVQTYEIQTETPFPWAWERRGCKPGATSPPLHHQQPPEVEANPEKAKLWDGGARLSPHDHPGSVPAWSKSTWSNKRFYLLVSLLCLSQLELLLSYLLPRLSTKHLLKWHCLSSLLSRDSWKRQCVLSWWTTSWFSESHQTTVTFRLTPVRQRDVN